MKDFFPAWTRSLEYSGPLAPPGLDSGLLALPGLDSGLLASPGLDYGLQAPPGLASGLLPPPGLDSGRPRRPRTRQAHARHTEAHVGAKKVDFSFVFQ